MYGDREKTRSMLKEARSCYGIGIETRETQPFLFEVISRTSTLETIKKDFPFLKSALKAYGQVEEAYMEEGQYKRKGKQLIFKRITEQ